MSPAWFSSSKNKPQNKALSKFKRAYFDYASTTPVDPRVLSKMLPYFSDSFGNASASYKEGVFASNALKASRETVAKVLQCQKNEVIFTSGGTESNNLAILGTYFHHRDVLKKVKIHFVTSVIEHPSVLEIFHNLEIKGAKVTYIKVGEDGIVDPKAVEEALTKYTVLVSIMYANNEIGTVQRIREIGKVIEEFNEKTQPSQEASSGEAKQKVIFHTDACQAGLYLPLHVHDLHVDLLSLDAGKVYGPKGVGVLYKKKDATIAPIMFGGAQEEGLRPGTENIPLIVGCAEAFKIAQEEKEKEIVRLKKETSRIISALTEKVPTLKVNGDIDERLPNNVNVCLPGLDAEYAVLRLDALGVALSSVTTCMNLYEDSSSYVIEEINSEAPHQSAQDSTEESNVNCSKSSLRITLGRYTTIKEVDHLIDNLLTIFNR